MRTIKNSLTFTKHFHIPETKFASTGALDVVLNLDTRLFIDPLLLASSTQAEMRAARKTFIAHFENVIKLLAASKKPGDIPWRNAARLLRFHEIGATCLGYGMTSVRGSGFGSFLSDSLMQVAKEIVDLGVKDPDLFLALALIEEGIGPDRISDMTTNIILPDIVAYNVRILRTLGITLTGFRVAGANASLPANPFQPSIPILLLPKDVLRSLPIVTDWADVEDAAYHNQVLREKVNREIGEIWYAKTRKDKQKLRSTLVASKVAFETFLEAIHSVSTGPYDTKLDKEGIVAWVKFIRMATADFPLDLRKWSGRKLTLADVAKVVAQIVSRFKVLIEDKSIWKEFWAGKKHRPESSAQRIFYAVADSYCVANDIDLSPEASSGNGPVDFKASAGHGQKVLVEIKLSTNSKLLPGYQKQIELYKKAEETTKGIYLVIDLGNLGKRADKLVSMYNAALEKGLSPSELVFVDASPKKSASKR
jgi:hypothetical protein